MTDKTVQEIKQALGNAVKNVTVKNPQRVYIDIDPQAVEKVARYLWKGRGARYAIATTCDNRTSFEVLHHFSLDPEDGTMVSVRSILDRKKPSMPSIAGMIEAASWIEREMSELMGIEFVGHPDMRRLLLTSDDWPDGVHPLRKDWSHI